MSLKEAVPLSAMLHKRGAGFAWWILISHTTYNDDACAALKKIAGEDFRTDRKQWQIWWRKNKDTFRKQ